MEMIECDVCGEEIHENHKFCPHCEEEQGLISWDWKEQPDWGVIEDKVNSIKGNVVFDQVDRNDDQYYLRVRKQ